VIHLDTRFLIAASAIQAGASLATGNPKDFRRLAGAGLRLADAGRRP